MARQTVLHGSHVGAVYISEESPFGTPGTEQRCHVKADSVDLQVTQAEVDRMRLSPSVNDYLAPVRGYKAATCALVHYLQPATTVLADNATPDADANAPLRVLMRCILGGESVAAGSVSAAGTYSSTANGTPFDVSSGDGANFPAGQIVAVDQSGNVGAEDLVPCRVRVRSIDTITVWPALAAVPSAGGGERVINSFTWYPTQTNTKSLSVALAPAQGTALEYRATGGTGSFELSFNRGELLEASFDLQFASHVGPADLSLGAAVAADPMAPPLSTRGAKLYLQPIATTTRTCLSVDSMTLRVNAGMEHRETLTCGVEGMSGTMRSAGLQEAFAEAELVLDVDTDYDTSTWTDQTELSMMFFVPFDAATSRRMVVVDIGRCVIVGKPAVARGANNLAKMTLVLRAQRDTSVTGTTDLATAPLRIAIL
jgi:hypothetical protein